MHIGCEATGMYYQNNKFNYEITTWSVKSTREMYNLTHCLTMVLSLELNAASVVIIDVLYRWGSHKWISEPC